MRKLTLLAVVLWSVAAFALIGLPQASDLQSMDCWSNCSSCRMHCKDRSCKNMCENINRVCCSAAGKRPYLSGCGCHPE